METRRSLIAVAALAVLLTSGVPAAEARHDDERDRDLAALAARIEGGAALLDDIASDRDVDDFHDRAKRFQRMLDDDRAGRIVEEWRELREQFGRLADMRGARNGRVAFLYTHLAEDVAAADRIVGRGGFQSPVQGGTGAAPGRISLLGSEICIGENRVGQGSCPSPRREARFRIPRGVSVIRRIHGEWRTSGRGVAQVYVDDRLVWESNVNRDWDADMRSDLNLPVYRGSAITVISKNDDPIWIRRLDVDYEGEADRDDRDGWGRY